MSHAAENPELSDIFSPEEISEMRQILAEKGPDCSARMRPFLKKTRKALAESTKVFLARAKEQESEMVRYFEAQEAT